MQCFYRKEDGSQCGAFATNGSKYCFQHDPARAAERQQARSRGGKARHGRQIGTTGSTPVAVSPDIDGITGVLARELEIVLAMEKSVTRSRTVGYLAEKLLRYLEFGELSERIAALEERLREKGL
jgi:hypothetical protein